MRYNVVRETALGMLQRFQQQGTVAPERRESLIDAAAQAETRRLRDEFRALPKGQHETSSLTPPDSRLSIERTLEKKSTYRGTVRQGELQTHKLETLKDDNEPYQETFEFTRFRPDGIAHATITICGDGGVGNGAIVSRAEFLSSDPDRSWREDSQRDFLGQDLLSLYHLGTYHPSL